MSNLLKLILEDIEYERLIEEGKDPVEVLHYKYQNVPTEIIDSVIEIDPTKKKSYSQWLLSKWPKEEEAIVSGLRNGRIAKLFQHYKEHNDIQIKDCPSVEEGLRQFVPEEDTVLTKSSAPTTTLMNRGWTEEVPSELANDFDIVFNEDDWIIAVPNTYEADCKLGENMNWCTAGGRSDFNGGRYYYNHYLHDSGGKYYVNFDMSRGESRLGKDYPFTRYQFHFESKQFMDKEDDPVELSEIGLPDSAKEFYSDEGYDTDNFENLEARIERYEEERWQASYALNDELRLNIAYDDDYQYEEPTPDTDFYLFSDDDDRDPICWEEVSNPHTDESVVILSSDDICILKKKYGKFDDGVIVAINTRTGGGWYRWETYSFGKYILLPENMGVFGVDYNDTFTFASDCGDMCFKKIKISECEKIFINKPCTEADAKNWGMTFIEAVADGYHSLFAISPDKGMSDDCDVIVKRDVPANKEYFVINEHGMIDGEFRSYRVYDDNYYGGESENIQYELESMLPTGDYLVSIEETDEYHTTYEKYNILKHGSNEPLINFWFDKYIGHTKNLYGIKATIDSGEISYGKKVCSKKIGFFSITNGQQVGRWYDDYNGIDQEKDILSGKIGDKSYPDKIDIINGFNGGVIGTFKNIISRKPINNKIVVLDLDGSTSKVFDYVEREYCFPELEGFYRIDQYDHPYIFSCNINGTEEEVLFDLSTQKVLVRGIKLISHMERYDTNYLRLVKMNDKCNVFDANKKVELLQNDVDDITGMNTYTHILVYYLNGKYYPLNYETGNIMINPNGIGVPTFVNNSEKIYCSSENYNIYFVPDNGLNNYKFYNWQNKEKYNDYGTNFDPQHTPQEVLQMYNLIFGQQESITKNFRNYVNRINEIMKLKRNDIVD